MNAKPAEKKDRRCRALSREIRDSDSQERARIRKAMRNWVAMDETAQRLGRGLGRRELASRVAREVGATLRQVQTALRMGN